MLQHKPDESNFHLGIQLIWNQFQIGINEKLNIFKDKIKIFKDFLKDL